MNSRYGRIFNYHFIANLLMSLPVKKIENRLRADRVTAGEFVVFHVWNTVYVAERWTSFTVVGLIDGHTADKMTPPADTDVPILPNVFGFLPTLWPGWCSRSAVCVCSCVFGR